MSWRFILSIALVVVGLRALSDPVVTSEVIATGLAAASLVAGVVGLVMALRKPAERQSAFRSLFATSGSRLLKAVVIAIAIFAVFAVLVMTGVIHLR